MAQNIQVALDAAPQFLGLAASRELSAPRSDASIPNLSVTSDLRTLEGEWRAFERRAGGPPF